jgi:hypothetical protein
MTTKKACNRSTLQPKVQKKIILPLNVEFIVCRHNLGNHKRGKIYLVPRNYSLL